MGHEIMLGLTSHPRKASGEQGLRWLPRGGALSPDLAALPALLEASPASPSGALKAVAEDPEVGREKHEMKFWWVGDWECSAWGGLAS